jgi:Lrp/AsnC family transcriptional regulator for asnA, asnC and gidA
VAKTGERQQHGRLGNGAADSPVGGPTDGPVRDPVGGPAPPRLIRGRDRPVPARNGETGPGADRRPIVLDDLAKRIIEELQRDGRRSYAAIAKSVGLSEAAVRQRVQRLLDSGAMQIVAVTDPKTVGFKRQAMIGIRADGDIREIAEQLSALPELEYVVVCAGAFDLLTELVCEDDEHLLQLLNERVRTIPGIRVTETFVYLRLIKQTYAWGTR